MNLVYNCITKTSKTEFKLCLLKIISDSIICPHDFILLYFILARLIFAVPLLTDNGKREEGRRKDTSLPLLNRETVPK